jgi:TRAP-type C4-dicarboxylate transport system permease small subunit
VEHSAEQPQKSAKPSRFIGIITRISSVMAAIGAVIFAGMMIITVIDVVGRKFFLHPLQGAVEIVGLTLVIGGTFGIGYAQLIKMHIRINIITDRFPRRLQSALWAFTCAVGMVGSGLIAWKAFVKTHDLYTTVLGSKTDILALPLWPIIAAMGFGFAWAAFVFLVDLVRTVNEVVKQ